MIEYRCPACRRLAFRASRRVNARIELKCNKCMHVVEPRPVGPLYAEYVCRHCGALSVRIAAPDGAPPLCVPCGARTLPVAPQVEVPTFTAYVSVSVA